MIFPLIISILANFIWAITNHIDKFLLSNQSKSNIKTLLVFSTLIAGIIFSPIWLVISRLSVWINLTSLSSIFFSAITYIIVTYFYFKSLEKNDASIVVVMFQLIPVFCYFLSFILFKETLTLKQNIGAFIIFSSASLISLDFNSKNNQDKRKALILMILSSLFYAFYYILFDISIRNSAYNSCAFWYQISLLIIGILFMCIPSMRKSFLDSIKTNGKKFFLFNSINELLNIIANLLVNFANTVMPIVLVNVLNGFQGMFSFLIAVIGIKFLSSFKKL